MFGVDIAGDPALNALGPIYCNSSSSNNVTKVGTLHGKLPDGAVQWREYGSITGYSGIAVRKLDMGRSVGFLISAIGFVLGPDPKHTSDDSPGKPTQTYGGIGDGEPESSICPEGTIIIGLFGTTNSYNIVTVGIRCQSSIVGK
jgi:hypothetical protein